MKQAKMIKYGNGGDSVYYTDGSIRQGYGTPESPHASSSDKDHELVGALVLDIRPALETDEGYRHVYAGPMPSVHLTPGNVKPCPVPSESLANAVSGTIYGSMLALQVTTKDKPGPLDSVSVEEYIEGWKQHGARTGRYTANGIEWDEEPAQ